MADPNRALFESVVRLLAPVLDELVFVGGCTTGLFITDPAAGGIRPTKDVDAIVDVTSYAEYTALAERLRALGLGEDTTSAPRSGRCSTIGTSPRRLRASSSRIQPVRRDARFLKFGFVRSPFPEHRSCFTRRA